MAGGRRTPSDVLIIIAIAVSIITSFGSLKPSQASTAEVQAASQDTENVQRSKEKKSTSATATKEKDVTRKEGATHNSADNTGQNARDKSGETLTPLDQSSDPQDLDKTQKIRKALVEDASLSTNAKNIKVITVHGTVTLRGPVDSAEERNKIVAKAKPIAGGQLKNELEIRSSK